LHPHAALTLHDLPDEGATRALGHWLGTQVQPGDLLFLQGNLGAGKTTLASGFLAGRGWTNSVRSPTYPILRTYPLAPPVHHLDLYRLGGLEEVLGLDIEALMGGPDILLVEWPDRMEGQFPPHWIVELEVSGVDRRTAVVKRMRP